MWYAKNINQQGEIISLVTYDIEQPIFADNCEDWYEITEEEYQQLKIELDEKNLATILANANLEPVEEEIGIE